MFWFIALWSAWTSYLLIARVPTPKVWPQKLTKSWCGVIFKTDLAWFPSFYLGNPKSSLNQDQYQNSRFKLQDELVLKVDSNPNSQKRKPILQIMKHNKKNLSWQVNIGDNYTSQETCQWTISHGSQTRWRVSAEKKMVEVLKLTEREREQYSRTQWRFNEKAECVGRGGWTDEGGLCLLAVQDGDGTHK